MTADECREVLANIARRRAELDNEQERINAEREHMARIEAEHLEALEAEK